MNFHGSWFCFLTKTSTAAVGMREFMILTTATVPSSDYIPTLHSFKVMGDSLHQEIFTSKKIICNWKMKAPMKLN